MTRFLLAYSGALFAGGTGAFFLFVPPVLIVTVTLLLMGFMLMFVLGVQVGSHSMLPADRVASPTQVAIRPVHL